MTLYSASGMLSRDIHETLDKHEIRFTPPIERLIGFCAANQNDPEAIYWLS